VSAAEFGAICLSGRKDGAAGRFVHPYRDPDVMAGAGVTALELREDLPAVDTVVSPEAAG
jgi:threonine dehydratase